MADVVGRDLGRWLAISVDPTSSQRWARTVVECTTCGQAVYRRAASREWIHRSTGMRYSNLTGPHLARPKLETLWPQA